MKYMFVVPKYPLGGAEKQALYYAKELANQGEEVFFLATESKSLCDFPQDENNITYDSLELAFWCQGKSFFYKIVSRVYAAVQFYFHARNNRDCCYIFYNPVFFLLFPFVKCGGAKIWFSIRENSKIFNRQFSLFCLRLCEKVWSNSYFVSELMKLKQVNCFVQLNYLTPFHVVDQAKKSTDDFRILCVANINRHKMIHTLIEAVNGLNCIVDVFGAVGDSGYYEELIDCAQRSSVEVNFHGYCSDRSLIEKYYSVCDLYVHPSAIEGTSNSIIDAILYLKPVLVSDIFENLFLVDFDEEASFFLGDVRSLHVKIKKIIDSSGRVDKGKLVYRKNRLLKLFNVVS